MILEWSTDDGRTWRDLDVIERAAIWRILDTEGSPYHDGTGNACRYKEKNAARTRP